MVASFTGWPRPCASRYGEPMISMNCVSSDQPPESLKLSASTSNESAARALEAARDKQARRNGLIGREMKGPKRGRDTTKPIAVAASTKSDGKSRGKLQRRRMRGSASLRGQHPLSRDDLMHDFAGHVSKAEIAAVKTVGQLLVIEAEQREDRGVQIV